MTRQYKWQLEQKKRGLCAKCNTATRFYLCVKHRKLDNKRKKRAYEAKRHAGNAESP